MQRLGGWTITWDRDSEEATVGGESMGEVAGCGDIRK